MGTICPQKEAGVLSPARKPVESSIPMEQASNRPAQLPKVGSIIKLDSNSSQEYRCSRAVVTKVADEHCTVVVLDPSGRFGVGESWPSFKDLHVESDKFVLGSRVVVHGMQGARTSRFNDLSGVITSHPREGHPVFIQKKEDRPLLVVCVLFDDPESAGQKSALLEPRFLRAFDEAVLEVSKSLRDKLANIMLQTAEEA